MKKLIKGIIEFRRNVLDSYKETFAQLALYQKPDSLFIGCSDSRVVPNLFASTNPGDLFVLRNIGNIIPQNDNTNSAQNETSVAAVIDFALNQLNVTNVIICGHSECAAISAIIDGRESIQSPHLRNWLSYGEVILQPSIADRLINTNLKQHNFLSQLNVLLQLDHLKTYPSVQEKLATGKITIHGWWFDIAKADVYAFEEELKQFVLIDETEAEKILERLK